MKMTTRFLVILFLISTQSCVKETSTCDSDYVCTTPPAPFEFELIDKQSGENLFTNGSFDPNDISVIDLEDESNVDFTFIDEIDYNVIRVNSIGWETETANYDFQVSSNSIFQLSVDAESKSENCCEFTIYHSIEILNSDFELNTSNGIYKILVE